jgi:ATP-binding cassette, subfamily B, bacterial
MPAASSSCRRRSPVLENLMPEQTTAEKSIANCARHLAPLLRPFRGPLVLAVVAMVFDALLTAMRPWPLKVVIDCVLTHRPSRVPFLGKWLAQFTLDPMRILYGACAATLLIAATTGLLTYFFTRTMGIVGQRYVFALRCKLFAHMQRLSLRFHDRSRTGDLVTRLTSDISAIQEVIAQGFILLASNGLLLLAMMGMMFWLNWRFALAALSVSPLLFWIVFSNTGRIRRAARVARISDGLLASVAQETLASVRVVQGLAQEQQQDDRFQAQGANSLEAYLEAVRYRARVAPLVDLLAAAGLAIVMWYGATRVLAGELTTGDVVVFFAYVTNLYAPMRALSRVSFTFNKASIGAERIADVLDTRTEVADRKAARAVPRLSGRIEFRKVSFEYEPGRPVLCGIDLSIARGERVAIVGATGAGKSTLVSLLPRFFDPTAGEIRIDGEDIRDFQLQSLRENIGLVLQDSLLFSGTIRENIAFGRPNASDEEIVAAAVAAHADEFIRQKPHGYETLVTERGASLSGGQKQRIAIARAMLRNAPILILDEPTSGLDAAAEKAVIDSLELAAAGRTTLLIAHRLSTIRFAHRVVVLECGQIIEQGTEAELMARNGRYAHLRGLQTRAKSEGKETLPIAPQNWQRWARPI